MERQTRCTNGRAEPPLRAVVLNASLSAKLARRPGRAGCDDKRIQSRRIGDTVAGALHEPQAHVRERQSAAVPPRAVTLVAGTEREGTALVVGIRGVREALLAG